MTKVLWRDAQGREGTAELANVRGDETRCGSLWIRLVDEGDEARLPRAGGPTGTAGEVVRQLNDLLAHIRLNLMDAGRETQDLHDTIPRRSYELIRESIRAAAGSADTARNKLGELRVLVGLS